MADIAMQKLTAEMPDEFEIAGEKPRPRATSLVNHFITLSQSLGLRQLDEVAANDVVWGKGNNHLKHEADQPPAPPPMLGPENLNQSWHSV